MIPFKLYYEERSMWLWWAKIDNETGTAMKSFSETYLFKLHMPEEWAQMFILEVI